MHSSMVGAMDRAARPSTPPRSASPASTSYEFSALENKRFTRLALTMQLVALLEMAAALLATPIAYSAVVAAWNEGRTVSGLLPAATVIVPAVVGAWTFRAGGHLRLIVNTQGDDIRHLMAAMGELTKLYLLQFLLFLGAVGFEVITLVSGWF